MKNGPSPIAHPTTDENARLWGFDIIEPVGTPKAWVHDWTSSQAGWDRPMQGMMDLGGLLGPIAEKREMAAYCRTLCGGMTDGYMQCEPTLLTARLVDIGEEGSTTRCVHLWTYSPEVFDELPEDFEANIPATTRRVLKERGVEGLER